VAGLAQFSGGIQGIVTDSSNAVIPGAQVTATNLSPQVSVVQSTDKAGNFTFTGLTPGQYEVQVQVKGFATATTTVTLKTAETLNLAVTRYLPLTASNCLLYNSDVLDCVLRNAV
jgi:hypothetical protein